jgi:hypothetical protein
MLYKLVVAFQVAFLEQAANNGGTPSEHLITEDRYAPSHTSSL